MLDGVLSVLQWRGDQRQALDRAELPYMSLVAGTLGSHLGQLEANEPELVARIFSLLGQADLATLRDIVLAPESTSRLLRGHPGRCDDRDLAPYLLDLLEAGPLQRRPGGLVVDLDSPAAVCFDYSTLHNGGMRLEHYADSADKAAVLGLLHDAMLGIEATDPAVADFVRRFTLVANAVVDAETAKFTSGSTSQYVGRSLFCNAHLSGVDAELMADSLVHEAIHSLLYMHEVCEPWLLDDGVHSPDLLVESPWSGATLLLRPFLQACFVWYGLVHFWSLAQGGSAFRPARVAARLATARSGFLKGPLEERISGHAPHIAAPVLDRVRQMQADVVSEPRQPSSTGDGAAVR